MKQKENCEKVLSTMFKDFAKDLSDYINKQDNDFNLNAYLTVNFVMLLKVFYNVALMHQLVNMLKIVSDIDAEEKGFIASKTIKTNK